MRGGRQGVVKGRQTDACLCLFKSVRSFYLPVADDFRRWLGLFLALSRLSLVYL